MALAYRIIGKATFSPDISGRAADRRTVCRSSPATDATRGERFMLGFSRWHLLKGLAAILCVVGIVSVTLIYVFPAPSSMIKIAAGIKGGSYELLAERYKEILARNHVKLEMRPSTLLGHLKLLQDQNSGFQVAFASGGIWDRKEAAGLLSLRRINYQIFCVFYPATEVLDHLTELNGKRIAVGPVGIGGRVVAEKVLGISGITSENSTLLPLLGQAAVNALKDGKADAAILGLSSDSPLIQTLLRDPGVRLMSVTDAEALTRIFPFVVRLVLPHGAVDYERRIPAGDIVLFATTNAVLVRNDLHPVAVAEPVVAGAGLTVEEAGGADGARGVAAGV
jgi:hypothetical protein